MSNHKASSHNRPAFASPSDTGQYRALRTAPTVHNPQKNGLEALPSLPQARSRVESGKSKQTVARWHHPWNKLPTHSNNTGWNHPNRFRDPCRSCGACLLETSLGACVTSIRMDSFRAAPLLVPISGPSVGETFRLPGLVELAWMKCVPVGQGNFSTGVSGADPFDSVRAIALSRVPMSLLRCAHSATQHGLIHSRCHVCMPSAFFPERHHAVQMLAAQINVLIHQCWFSYIWELVV